MPQPSIFLVKVFFYETQLKYLFPVVNEAWEAESSIQINSLTSIEVVNLDGDGRCVALDIVPYLAHTL